MKLARIAKDKAQKISRTIAEVAEHEKTRAALEWTKRTAVTATDEATRIGKQAAETKLAKDAATYAAIGAAVAVPIPLIGPVGGAIVGAGLAVFNSLKKRQVNENNNSLSASSAQNFGPVGVYDELLKLSVLREKGILTEEEYALQKRRLLKTD